MQENIFNEFDIGTLGLIFSSSIRRGISFVSSAGREKGTNETIKDFLKKPKTRAIITLLNRGKTVRDIAGRLNVSLNLVVKVRKHHKFQPVNEVG